MMTGSLSRAGGGSRSHVVANSDETGAGEAWVAPAPSSTDWRRPAFAMFAAGYGANQFVPLLAVYRHELGLSDAGATAVFGVYALGLIPGFLIGGPASDRYGRRPIMLGFAVLSLVATAVLITGGWSEAGLYAGRLLTGVVSGTVFTVGTAWVKELSRASPGATARRAALALTAGFGIGPLVAGPLAEWGPLPTVLPYLVHLGLATLALVLLPRTPETRHPTAGPRGRFPVLVPPSARSGRFRAVVLPLAPWVFGSVTLDFTTLPAHGVLPLRAVGVAFPGFLAAAGLGAGLAGQSWGGWLHAAARVRRDARAAAVGLAVIVAGLFAAAAATAWPGVAWVTAAAVVLGVGYGVCLVTGIREVEMLATPDDLGRLVALFYCLAYSGLAIPFLLALVAPHTGYPPALLLTATVGALTLVLVVRRGRRDAVG